METKPQVRYLLATTLVSVVDPEPWLQTGPIGAAVNTDDNVTVFRPIKLLPLNKIYNSRNTTP